MKMWHGLAIAAALSTTVASPALAWWPRGGGGNASYERSATGPEGQTWSSSGSATYGGGSGSGERSATGPEGQTWSSSGSATYGGGSGSGERTVTTPYGGSYSRSGSYSRW
jgi:hypothetical protein